MTGYTKETKPWSVDRQYAPQPAVHWLAPRELLNGAIRAVISKTFGDYSDRRETFAILKPHAGESDPALERSGLFIEGDGTEGDFWFDYVSDVGDGFSATYSIAELLAEDSLSVEGEVLRRGEMLIMGGDQVYPTPGAEPYKARTVGPYETALQYLYEIGADGSSREVALSLYALPGNHDWYDGLSAFIKQFCTRQWIGAWRTRQHRSYFAVKLPSKWWLWGIDIAFDGPIDTAQMDYFKMAAESLESGDAIVLCTAKPTWIKCPATSSDPPDDAAYNNLRYLISETVPSEEVEVRLILSGDKHHYARYAELDAGGKPVSGTPHMITAGGGGAYLSSTNDLPKRIRLRERRGGQARTLDLDEVWPDAKSSRRLGWRALWRVPRTWSLVVAWGLVYALMVNLIRESAAGLVASEAVGSAGLVASIESFRAEGMWWTFGQLLTASVNYSPFWILAIVMLVGTTALANKGHPRHRGFGLVLGALHTAVHLAAGAAVTSLGFWLAAGQPIYGTEWLMVSLFVLTTLLVGAALGTLVFTAYLIGASYVKRNLNELFIGIRWEGYKNFVRLRIDEEGVLHVRVLGLRKVDRRGLEWEDDVPAPTGSPAKIELIDSVSIRRRGS